MRLTGHEQELVALDRGLTDGQRELLAPHVTLIDLPEAAAERGLLAKPIFHRYLSGGVLFWLDADVIVTGSLAPVIECAVAGSICAYPDDRPSRWFAEWDEAFGLREPLRRQVYVNGGVFAASSERLAELGPRWEELCASIPVERVFRDVNDPFWAADQDALNALLMSEIDEGSVTVMPKGDLAFPTSFRQVEIDELTLAAQLSGRTVRLLHYAFLAKPWHSSAWSQLHPRDAYVRVLPRLLLGDDVRLKLEPETVPAWLRLEGAGLVRAGGYSASLLRSVARSGVGHLPAPVRGPIVSARRRLVRHPRELE